MPVKPELSFADIIQQEIERRAAESFLQKQPAARQRELDDQWGGELSPEVARANEILGAYANAAHTQDAILNLIPSPGKTPRITKNYQARAPKPKPVDPNSFDYQYLLGVVAPFLKKERREKIKKAMDSGEIYDKTSRIDPDDKEVPGITDKVKQKRSEMIHSWNPEVQMLHRMQAEEPYDGISQGQRGGVFYSPNYRGSYINYGGNKTLGNEGGENEVIKHKKFNNPFFIRRGDSEYIGNSGLQKLVGNVFSTNLNQGDIRKKLPKWALAHVNQQIRNRDPITSASDNWKEQITNLMLKRYGYDAAVATRASKDRIEGYDFDPNIVKGEFSDLKKPVMIYDPNAKIDKNLKYKDGVSYPLDQPKPQGPYSIIDPVSWHYKKSAIPLKTNDYGINLDDSISDYLPAGKDAPYSIPVMNKRVKPLTANQLVEIGFDKEKAKAYNSQSKRKFRSLIDTIPPEYIDDLTKKIVPSESVKLKKIKKLMGELLEPYIFNQTYISPNTLPDVQHGPASYLQLEPFKRPPKQKDYEKALEKLLSEKLLKYKKEHKPKP